MTKHRTAARAVSAERRAGRFPLLRLGLCALTLAFPGCAEGTEDVVVTNQLGPRLDASTKPGEGGGGGDSVDGGSCGEAWCAAVQADCGEVLDSCGAVVSCGVCTAGTICGGGGANRCGTEPCMAVGCADVGAECGQISDGCSVVVDCGSCPGAGSCQANKCSDSGAGGAAGAAGASGQGGAGGIASGGSGGGCAGGITCYRDVDGDGYGDPGAPDSSGCQSCAAGYVKDNTDCNDNPTYGAKYHPGQTECFDTDLGGGWDYNCNGSSDPATEGCTACGAASVNPRWCSSNCSLQVWKLLSLYSACGVAGKVTMTKQTCGDDVDCGGTYPLTNDVGYGSCTQKCK